MKRRKKQPDWWRICARGSEITQKTSPVPDLHQREPVCMADILLCRTGLCNLPFREPDLSCDAAKGIYSQLDFQLQIISKVCLVFLHPGSGGRQGFFYA